MAHNASPRQVRRYLEQKNGTANRSTAVKGTPNRGIVIDLNDEFYVHATKGKRYIGEARQKLHAKFAFLRLKHEEQMQEAIKRVMERAAAERKAKKEAEAQANAEPTETNSL